MFGNCGSFIALRVGATDAPIVTKHLMIDNPRKLIDQSNYRAIAKFLVSERPTNPIRLELSKLPDIGRSHAEQIIARSRNERGRPQDAVRERIRRFLAPDKGAKKEQRGSLDSLAGVDCVHRVRTPPSHIRHARCRNPWRYKQRLKRLRYCETSTRLRSRIRRNHSPWDLPL